MSFALLLDTKSMRSSLLSQGSKSFSNDIQTINVVKKINPIQVLAWRKRLIKNNKLRLAIAVDT